jgi:hypothetical protein
VVPDSFGGRELVIVAIAYLLLGLWIFARQRAELFALVRDGFRTSYRQLVDERRTD